MGPLFCCSCVRFAKGCLILTDFLLFSCLRVFNLGYASELLNQQWHILLKLNAYSAVFKLLHATCRRIYFVNSPKCINTIND